MTTVRCTICKMLLDEMPGIPPIERKPCPYCGATPSSREYGLSICEGIEVNDTIGHEMVCGDTGRRTSWLTPEQKRQGGLVVDWVKCKSTSEFLEHSSAHLFRQSIRSNPIVQDKRLILFRGRFLDEKTLPTVKPTDFGTPPADQTKAGRYNVAGRPVLYLSSSEEGGSAEKRLAEESAKNLFCQRFILSTNGLKIADFALDSIDNFIRIVFDYAENGIRTGQIDKNDYTFSQVVAAIVEASGFDGMIVPGVRGSPTLRYNNVVVFSPIQWIDWVDVGSLPKCIDAIERHT